MQLNLSFPPSFPSNVAWHPPLIRKARTRCDLCRALHDFARLRLTSQCLPAGNYGWRVWTQRGWLPINLLIYERRPWNAHGQHSWTPWHHWLQHQDYQIQRRISQRQEFIHESTPTETQAVLIRNCTNLKKHRRNRREQKNSTPFLKWSFRGHQHHLTKTQKSRSSTTKNPQRQMPATGKRLCYWGNYRLGGGGYYLHKKGRRLISHQPMFVWYIW